MELSFHRNLPQSDHHSLSTGYTCKNSCSSSSPAHKCHCFGKRSFYCIVVYIHRLGRYTRKRKDNFYLSNFLHFDIAREMNIPPKFLTMENLLCLKKVRKQGWILQFYDSALYFTSDELGLGYCWVSQSACWLSSEPSSPPVNQQVTLSIFQSVSLSVWARKSVRWSVLSIHTNLQYHVIT